MLKKLAANAGDLGSVPGLGKSPREGNSNPFQYSCLDNSMDRGASHTHTQRSIIQSLKKKEILPFATIYMDFEGIKLSEVRETKTNTA